MSANLYKSVLNALLRKSIWHEVREVVEGGAFTETTTRFVVEQIAHLHGRIAERDLDLSDLRLSILANHAGQLGSDLVSYAESMGEAAAADESVVREMLARQLLGRAAESILQAQMAGRVDVATPEEFIRKARELQESSGASGVMTPDQFDLPSARSDRGAVIPFGVSRRLDSVMDGGSGEGELIVIVSKPKLGKTSMMRAMAGHMRRNGANVLDLTLEVRAAKIMRLYEREAIHKTKTEWTDEDTRSAREQMLEGGKLWIKDLSYSEVTCATVESLIRSVERESGEKVHVVVVDYLELMSVGKSRSTIDMRFQYAKLAKDLRAVAGRTKTRVITAWQINREGAKKDTANETDLSECWDIFKHVDAMFILNQTTAEKTGSKTMRLLIAAQREDADAVRTLPLFVDWSRMIVQDQLPKEPSPQSGAKLGGAPAEGNQA